jgi:hypothetical protein
MGALSPLRSSGPLTPRIQTSWRDSDEKLRPPEGCLECARPRCWTSTPKDRLPYIVTEFIAGGTLRDSIKRDGPWSPADVERLGANVAAALTAIHGVDVIHRDLKPSNIMLSPAGPLVIDFGIAQALDATTEHTPTGNWIGTPKFTAPEQFGKVMAPEQSRGMKLTPAVDVFAWGVLMVYASTGRYPFGSDSNIEALGNRVMNEEPDLTGLDERLREVVAKALDKDPVRRPDAAQLRSSLAQVKRTAQGAKGSARRAASITEAEHTRQQRRTAQGAKGSPRRAASITEAEHTRQQRQGAAYVTRAEAASETRVDQTAEGDGSDSAAAVDLETWKVSPGGFGRALAVVGFLLIGSIGLGICVAAVWGMVELTIRWEVLGRVVSVWEHWFGAVSIVPGWPMGIRIGVALIVLAALLFALVYYRDGVLGCLLALLSGLFFLGFIIESFLMKLHDWTGSSWGAMGGILIVAVFAGILIAVGSYIGEKAASRT